MAGLLLLISLGKLVAARRHPLSPGMGCLLGFFLSFAVSLLFSADLTWYALVTYTTPELLLAARLVSNMLQMLAVHFLLRLARTISTPGAPTRLWPLLLCWVLMVLCLVDVFLNLEPPGSTSLVWRPGAIAYQLVLVGYALGCLVVFTSVVHRHARRCPPGSFRTGLRLIVAAAVLTTVWGVWAGLPTLWEAATGLSFAVLLPRAQVPGVAAVLLWVAGAVLTTWKGVLERPARWLAARCGERAVTPLWSALVAALPEIALATPAHRQGVEFRLYRKLIEIQDGLLALRGHTPPEVGDWLREAGPVAESAPERLAAAAAAALVVRGTGRSWPQPSAPAAGAPSIEAETAWLSAVSAAFTGSPVVDEVRRRAVATYVTGGKAPQTL